MYKRYIIRYEEDGFIIRTISVKTEEERDAIIKMIEKQNYEYVVIASKDNKHSKFVINCMLDFEEFRIGSDN